MCDARETRKKKKKEKKKRLEQIIITFNCVVEHVLKGRRSIIDS